MHNVIINFMILFTHVSRFLMLQCSGWSERSADSTNNEDQLFPRFNAGIVCRKLAETSL